MLECIYCAAEVGSEHNFCGRCFRQARCIHCATDLIADTPICLRCGKRIAEVTVSSPPSAINKFVLEEQQTETSAYRRVQGEFTDAAVDKVAFVLGSIRHPIQRLGNPPVPPGPKIKELSGSSDRIESYAAAAADQEEDEPKVVIAAEESNTISIFEADGEDSLVATIVDFKGKNIKEQQSRFCLLYIWAYFEIFRKPMPVSLKGNIAKSAKITGLYDKNFTTYQSRVIKEYAYQQADEIKVTGKGREQIKLVMQEINDNAIEGYPYWKPSGRTIRRMVRGGSADESQINEWLNIDTGLDDFDIRKLKTSTDYVLFSLLLLTKKINVVQSANLKTAYLYLTRKFKTISIKQIRFSEAFSRSYNRSKFKRNPDGEYYLTEEGQKLIEELITSS